MKNRDTKFVTGFIKLAKKVQVKLNKPRYTEPLTQRLNNNFTVQDSILSMKSDEYQLKVPSILTS